MTKASLDEPHVVDELCDRIAEGKGIYEVCKADDMPDESTVYRRMARDEAFAGRIARARVAQQDAIIDKNRQLAREATVEDWQVKRLEIWNNQWTAAKLAPKKYGDVSRVKHSGAVGTFDAAGMTDEQLNGIESAIEAALGGVAAGDRDAAAGEDREGEAGG